MNIIKCHNFEINIDYLPNPVHTVIYSYERIHLRPEEIRLVKLPYQRNDLSKSYKLEIDKKLAQIGLVILWSNINSEESVTCLEFLLKNTNINHEYERNDLTNLIGSGKIIDIIPNSILGRIYE